MARKVLVETGDVLDYTAGRGNLVTATTGERDKSSARAKSEDYGANLKQPQSARMIQCARAVLLSVVGLSLPDNLVNDKGQCY